LSAQILAVSDGNRLTFSKIALATSNWQGNLITEGKASLARSSNASIADASSPFAKAIDAAVFAR